MKRKLNDSGIKGHKPQEKKYEVRDGGGLALWVYPSGLRSWVYVYEIEKKKDRQTLGHYPSMSLAEAREKHEEAWALVKQGVNPKDAQKERQEEEKARKAAEAARRAEEELAPTVSKLVDDYLKGWAKRKKGEGAEDKRQLEKDVKPRLGSLKVRDVTKRHIRELVESVAVGRGAPIAANRLLSVVRRMFNFAVEEEVIEESPCRGIRPPGGKESKRDRVLSPDEVRAFWEGLDRASMAPETRRALRLILVTGQRPGEVVGMRWEEVEDGWWTIPAEKSKNGLSHRVPLSKLALEVLGTKGEGPVFPSRRKDVEHVHINALGHAVRLNWEAFKDVGIFTPHDLRRTAASLMASIRVDPYTVERVLNHKLQGVQAVYNRHSYDAEKKRALDVWARELGRILEGKKGGEVIPFAEKRRRWPRRAAGGDAAPAG